MNHWLTPMYLGRDVWLGYSAHPPRGIFSQFSKGKLINLNLSRASGLSLLAVLTEICPIMDGNSHQVLVPIMGSGSEDQQNLANVHHYLSTSCLKVFYKMSCWEETCRSGLEYIHFLSVCLPCKVVCSVSELTSCADSPTQQGPQCSANVLDQLQANLICKPLLSNVEDIPPWKNVKQSELQQSHKVS